MQTKGKYFFSRNLMFYTWIFSDSGSVGLLYAFTAPRGIPEGKKISGKQTFSDRPSFAEL